MENLINFVIGNGGKYFPINDLQSRYIDTPYKNIVPDNQIRLGNRRSDNYISQTPQYVYNFDGSNDAINASQYAPIFLNSAKFTFSALVNPDIITADITGAYRIFTFGTSGGSTRFALAYNAGYLSMLRDGGGIAGDQYYDIQTQKWVHLVVTSNMNNNHKLYINGSLFTSSTLSFTSGDVNVFNIGSQAGTFARYFDGKMSLIDIFDDILTDQEVLELYKYKQLALPTKKRAIRFTCEDTNPKIAYDVSGHGRHAEKIDITQNEFHVTDSSVPRESNENTIGYTPVTYITSSTTDSLKFAEPLLPSGNNWKIETEFFIDPSGTTAPAERTIFSQYIGVTNNGRVLLRAQLISGLFIPELFMGSSNGGSFSNLFVGNGTTALETNRFYKITAVRASGNAFGLYLDDQLLSGKTDGSANRQILQTSAYIGSNNGSTTALNGGVKYFKFWEEGVLKSELIFDHTPDYLTSGNTIFIDQSNNNKNVSIIGTASTRQRLKLPAANIINDVCSGILTYRGYSPIDGLLVNGHCATGDGVDSVIRLGNKYNPASKMLWEFSTIPGSDTALVGFWSADNGAGSTNRAFSIRKDDGVKDLTCFLPETDANITNYLRFTASGFALDTGEEYHILVYYDGQTIKMAINGIEKTMIDTSAGTWSSGTVPTWNNANQTCLLGLDNGYSNDASMWDCRYYTNDNAKDRWDNKLDRFYFGSPDQHWPLSEGSGMTQVLDTVSGYVGIIYNADTSLGGSFWGTAQNSYHHNLTKGYSRSALLDTGFTSGVRNSTGPSVEQVWYSPVFSKIVSVPGAHSNEDYDVEFIGNGSLGFTGNNWILRQNNLSLSSGVPLVVECEYQPVSGLDGTGNDYLQFARRYYNIFSTVMSSGNYGKWVPLSGELTMTGQYDQLLSTNSETFVIGANLNRQVRLRNLRVYKKDGTSPYIVPARNSKVDARGFPLLFPANKLHNLAESKIDWTGGVDLSTSNNTNNLATNFTNTLAATLTPSGVMIDEHGRQLKTYTLIEDNTASFFHQTSSNSITTTSGFVTMSIYAKEISGSSKRYLSLSPVNASARFASFNIGHLTVDLSNGSGHIPANYTEWYEIKDVGNGWYKCSLIVNTTSAGTVGSTVRLSDVLNTGADANPEAVYDGDGSSGLEITEWMIEDEFKYPDRIITSGVDFSLDTQWEPNRSSKNPNFQNNISNGSGKLSGVSKVYRYNDIQSGPELNRINNNLRDRFDIIYDGLGGQNNNNLGLNWKTLSGDGFKINNNHAELINGESYAININGSLTSSVEGRVTVTSWSSGDSVGIILYGDEDFNGYLLTFKNQFDNCYNITRLQNGSGTVIQTFSSGIIPAVPFELIGRIKNNTLTGHISAGQQNLSQEAAVITSTVSGVDFSSNRLGGIYTDSSSVDIVDFKLRDI